MYSRRIPAELCDIIIDHLWNDPAALAACSLTSRNWLPAARFHLFRTVVLDSPEKLESFDALLHGRCSTLSNVAAHVRSLSLDMKELETDLNDHDLLYMYNDDDSEDDGELAYAPGPEALMAANYHIIRISKQLRKLRSLTLSNIDSAHRMLKADTMRSIISMSHGVEAIRLRRIVFDDADQLVQLLQASPKLSSVSLQYVLWRNVYFTEKTPFQWIPNRSIDRNSKATIANLDFVDCPSPAVAAVMASLRMPSFKLCLRDFSISASELDVVIPDLSRDGAGNTIETLRLDYSNVFDYEDDDEGDGPPELSDLPKLKTLRISCFHLLSKTRKPHSHVRLAKMLSHITSPALSSIFFTGSPWAPSWQMDSEGWAVLDDALAQLVKSRPELRVVFSFNSELPPCPRSQKVLVLEEALRTHLPLFLSQRGQAEVTMTPQPDAIYGSRVAKL